MGNIDYLTKDYEGFRTDLINNIPDRFPEWTDFTQSNAGIMLIELLCYGLDILSYYQDRMINEMFLSTAVQRKSILDLAKFLSYQLQEATPSTVTLTFKKTSIGDEITIPIGTKVATKSGVGEEAIIFETDETLVITDGTLQDTVGATQGKTIPSDILGSSDGITPNQRYKLKYTEVISDSLDIFVDDGTGFEKWKDITDTIITDPEGKHYWREIDADNYMWIQFGNGITGKIPDSGGNNIKAEYRVGGGAYTNVGANTITRLLESIAGIDEVWNEASATGGTNIESIEEVRVNAPRNLRTNDRCVTLRDYKDMAEIRTEIITVSAVVGSKSSYVDLYILQDNEDWDDGVFPSEYEEALLAYFEEIKTIGQTVFIEEPVFKDIDLLVEIKTDENYINAEVEQNAEEIIEEFFKRGNLKFNEDIHRSHLCGLLIVKEYINTVDITITGDSEADESEIIRLNNLTVTSEGGL